MGNSMQRASSVWKVAITTDSMLNGLQKKGLSKNHCVKMDSFPPASCETILENIDVIIKSKSVCLVFRAGTNDLTNEKNC